MSVSSWSSSELPLIPLILVLNWVIIMTGMNMFPLKVMISPLVTYMVPVWPPPIHYNGICVTYVIVAYVVWHTYQWHRCKMPTGGTLCTCHTYYCDILVRSHACCLMVCTSTTVNCQPTHIICHPSGKCNPPHSWAIISQHEVWCGNTDFILALIWILAITETEHLLVIGERGAYFVML